MVSWAAFAAAAPALAALGRRRLEDTGLVMLGTLRRDGSPRLTPIEFFFFEDDLTTGGMWQSKKCQDLLRDPRCVLHSTTTDKAATQGDFKLYGRAFSIDEARGRERYGQALEAATGWRPGEPFHLFRIDIREAAFVVFGESVGPAEAALRAEPGNAAIRLLDAGEGTGYLVATWKA